MSPKLYINTDVSIPINIGTGLVISDIISMTVTLTRVGDASGVTFSSPNIVMTVDSITLNIPDTGGISLPGAYAIKILFVDGSGNVRGLTATPEYLLFNE